MANRCEGTYKNGKPCRYKAKHEGFCKIHTPKNTEESTDITFSEWAKSTFISWKTSILPIVAILTTTYNILLSVNIRLGLDSNFHTLALFSTQLAVIFIIITILAFGKPPTIKHKKDFNRGNIVMKQFWSWWTPLWGSWIALYVGFVIWESYKIPFIGQTDNQIPEYLGFIVKAIFNFLNNISTLILLMLFHILSNPSVEEPLEPEGDIFIEETKKTSPNTTTSIDTKLNKFVFWITLLIIATSAEISFINYYQNNPSLVKEIVLIFAFIYGISATTAFVLVIGKLDSHLLGVPTSIIAFLMIYSAIQPFFPLLVENNMEEKKLLPLLGNVLISIALLGKIFLFAVVQWLIHSDRLIYYMAQSYSIVMGVDENRRNFFDKEKQTKKNKKNEILP